MPDDTRSAPPGLHSDQSPTADRAAVAGPDWPTADPADGSASPAAGPPPVPGYELLGEVGRGGMGVVYRARDRALERDVAVKLLAVRYAPDSAAASRFVEEARITAQLQHPGIPAVHQVGHLPDGRPFIAMKLIKGRTLDELLAGRSEPAADRGRFLAIFEQVCQAVGYAHAHRVVHRDLKPANVMVGTFGEVQVMDWGLAKVLGEPPAAEQATPAGPELTEIRTTRDSDGAHTQAGSLLGTPAYMPPEQAIGAVDQIDTRSDVFGLGAVLCTVLTGRPPYAGETAESARQLAARARLGDAHARLAACGAEPELVALCERCLAPEPADRPADAGEVAAAVAALRADADERARRAELDRVKVEGERAAADLRAEAEAQTRRAAEQRAAEQRKRRRVQLALAAAVGLLLSAGATFAWWQDRQAAAERGRRGRNAEAVAALLDQAEAALKAGDAAKAGPLLEAADRRAAEGGADESADRLGRLRADEVVLRELDAADRFRWTPLAGKWRDAAEIAGRFRAALATFGADPDAVPPEEAADRVAASAVQDRLVTALDRLLWQGRSERVRAALRVADPDPLRDAVRDAVLKSGWQAAELARLAGDPRAADQPPGFVAFLGESTAVPVERRRELLVKAVGRRPGDLALLMALGGTYKFDRYDETDHRVRWYQAAVAVAPTNAAALTNLGLAVREKGDLDGAVFYLTKAIHLDPRADWSHAHLGWVLHLQGDLDGSAAQFTEAAKLQPDDPAHCGNLRFILVKKGDWAGAVACFRELVGFAPNSVPARNNLGYLLGRGGDLDGAIAEYKAVLRLDPTNANALTNLPQVERMRALLPRLPGVLAGTDRPATPAEAVGFAYLCVQTTHRRYAAAARLLGPVFAADPKLAADLSTSLRYNAACYAARAARGDGADAPADPAERAALRARAVGWLRADLALRQKQATSSSGSERRSAQNALTQWLVDPDLWGVRPGLGRVGMPAAERAECDALWADVRAALADARKSPPPPEAAPPPRPVK